ncbi:glutamine-hydrolyzing carbamoyl-phosphate synthase small subunit [Propionimicrobium lymphophilum]|uniref:glutamine-hydrolyzing carbamoyl-phosphate synthase small subunit n=1 Tax=Propionimicrobium lymphophilum TaxID=33012 RepID=UPI00041CAAA8|nr:glutamine-hydrolyzing carbamoyl-phosphate synthase small subunit [Propionimicrobium lymphophilum]
MNFNRQPAILVLEDGRVFHGRRFGATGETYGEGVFSTGMSGYQETLTDPSYFRQIVVATAPHIGNTGWNDQDDESNRIWVAGYVVRDPARVVSNWRANRSLEDELINQGIVGICDLDTRALTIHLRESGAMRMAISSEDTDEKKLLEKVRHQPRMAGANLVQEVTASLPYVVPAMGEKKFVVAALDLGIKANTPREMAKRGIETHIFPAGTEWEEIFKVNPDGFFISNGPGDPATADQEVELTKRVLEEGLPLFGICFGNQILGRALGFDTYKLKYGHRGINQPVLERETGRIDITAHNHGFALDVPLDKTTKTEFGEVKVSHICLNDDVVEGLELHKDGKLRAFSVQYHPEAAAGPHDAEHLFDRFVRLMQNA